jgi:hypothetical protein
MSEAQIEEGHRERTAQMIRLAELLAAGAPADADPVARSGVPVENEQ